MKLDPKTISVLQNFQTINPQIAIDPGNVLMTVTTSETLVARATVPTEFPIPFGIYDLSKFLAMSSLLKDADLEFHDTYFNVKSGPTNLKFVYADTEMMIKPPKKVTIPNGDIEFELRAEVYSSIMKAMSILKYSKLAVIGDGKNMSLVTVNDKNKNSDDYSVTLGETDKTFRIIIEVEQMKMIPMNYVVKISKGGIAYFKGDGLEYWIATHTSSKFD